MTPLHGSDLRTDASDHRRLPELIFELGVRDLQRLLVSMPKPNASKIIESRRIIWKAYAVLLLAVPGY